MLETLDVILWGKKAGTLVTGRNGYRKEYCFLFDREFVKLGLDIAPLRASITGASAQRGLPIYPDSEKIFGGLPSFIADSLPDHWGNTVFSEWAKSRHIRSKDLSPLDRLAYIGRRGMGALEFVPPSAPESETPFKVEIAELSRLAQTALKEARQFHAVMSPDFMIENLFKVGTSAGGRRPKAVINVNPASGECYSGQVAAPDDGFVPMIIKFDEHVDIPSTRIEYSFYLMAESAGMKMMPSRLTEGANEAHFLTERFDRKGNRKLHIQTLAAMNPASDSYEDLFDTAIKTGITPEEISQLFLQTVMNISCGNVDDHNKNFSFMMDTDGVWHTTPAYDFTFTVNPSAPFYINRHSMSVNGRNEEISRGDLLTLADRMGIKCAESLVDRACASARRYREFGERAGVPDKWILIIEREIGARTNLLRRECREIN